MKYAFGITAGSSHYTAVDFGKLHGHQCLLAGKQNGEIEVRCFRTLRPIVRLNGTESCQVRSCGFSKEGVWAHFRGSSVNLWQVLPDLTSTLIKKIPVPYSGFSGAVIFDSRSVGDEVAILPEDSNDWAVVTIHCLQQQRSYSLKASQSTVLTKAAESNIFSLLPIEDHSTKFKSLYVLLGTEFGSIQLWDVRKEAIVLESRIHKEIVSELDFSPERSVGVSCSPADGVSVWTIDGSFCIQQTCFVPKQKPSISHVQIFPDYVNLFVAGDGAGTLTLLSLITGEKKDVFNFHRKAVTCVRFVRRDFGDWILVVCSSEGVISCWEIDMSFSSSPIAHDSTAAFISA